jgi:RTX calcium-binding nonapeptide repeat (4 copies)
MRRFISKFAAKTASTKYAPAKALKKWPRARLGIERLEQREVPAVASLSGTTLQINGTVDGEVIELRSPAANRVEVVSNASGQFEQVFGVTDAGILTINASGTDTNGAVHSHDFVIRGVPTGVTNLVNVSNFDRVTVGDENAAGLFSLDNVRSRVSAVMPVDGELLIRGDAATADKTVNVNAGFVNGLSPFNILYQFAGGPRSRLTLSSGSGNDTVNVNGTPALGAFGLTISTNGGADTFNVAADTARLRLNGGDQNDTFNLAPASKNMVSLDKLVEISGGGGTNSLVMNDQSRAMTQQVYDATFSVEPQGSRFVIDQLNSQSGQHDLVSVFYSGVQSVRYAAPTAAGARVHVLATAPGVATVIDSNGASQVDLGGGNLDGIQGAVTVNRATAGGRIVLDDSAHTTAEDYVLEATSVDRDGMARVSFDNNTSEVRVLAGSANDTFFLNALRGSALVAGRRVPSTYRLDGGGGLDELRAPNTSNFWDVTANDAGTLNTNVLFGSVENLQGGTGDDHFHLANGRVITGFIEGNPILEQLPANGFDTLDYSAYASGVNVDLAQRRGTNVGGNAVGRLTGIDAIFGGSVRDALTGDGGANVIVGNGGDDLIRGGGGRDILIGGDGRDDLNNKAGNPGTIYVDGITAASVSTPAALKALRAEWTRTDANDAQKKAHITNGGGLNGSVKLNATTISNDVDVDIIHPGTGVDLIFLHTGDLLDGNQPAAEVVQL